MFGNHPLPNIGPSHLFHLPPPSHHPAVVAVPTVPLVSAQMGQARAFSSTPAAANHVRRVTAAATCVRHVTAAATRHFQLRPPRHRCQRPPTATLLPLTTPNDTSPAFRHHQAPTATSPPSTCPKRHVTDPKHLCRVTTAAPPLLKGCGHRNQ